MTEHLQAQYQYPPQAYPPPPGYHPGQVPPQAYQVPAGAGYHPNQVPSGYHSNQIPQQGHPNQQAGAAGYQQGYHPAQVQQYEQQQHGQYYPAQGQQMPQQPQVIFRYTTQNIE